MKRFLYTTAILFCLLLHLKGQEKTAYNTPEAGNPILPGYFADPTVRKFGDTYYIYATTDGTAGGLGPSQVWKSKDFKNWFIEPMNWPATRQIWAPDVMQGPDGRYYFYYCVACMVYCAVSDFPTGPWKNILDSDGDVLIPDRYIQGAITLDPQSFVDDDGSVYLYWGTWGIYPGHGCGAGRLNPDMTSFADTLLIPNTQLTDFFEAPFVFKRNGIYYMTYSSGSCHDHTYRVQYATSTEGPLGPYVYADNNPILETSADRTVHGPGHHSILQEGEDYYIVYHRHNIPFYTRGFHRQVAADRLTFDEQGRIHQIEAGHSGIGLLAPDSNPFPNIALGAEVKASSCYGDDFRPQYALDDNNATLWRAAECRPGEWLEIDLSEKQRIRRIWTQFEHPTAFYQYIYETSVDGKTWNRYADRSKNIRAGSPMSDKGDEEARYLRLWITGMEKNGQFPAVWNIRVFTGGEDPFPAPSERFNEQAVKASLPRNGLIFTVDASEYKSGDTLHTLACSGQPVGYFTALKTPLPVTEYNGKQAFVFDGSQQFRSNFILPATVEGNSPFTVSAWIASPNPGANDCIMDIGTWGELEKIKLCYGTEPRGGLVMHNG